MNTSKLAVDHKDPNQCKVNAIYSADFSDSRVNITNARVDFDSNAWHHLENKIVPHASGLIGEFRNFTSKVQPLHRRVIITLPNFDFSLDHQIYFEYLRTFFNAGVVEVSICGRMLDTINSLWDDYKTFHDSSVEDLSIFLNTTDSRKWCTSNDVVIELSHIYISGIISIKRRFARGTEQRFVLRGVHVCRHVPLLEEPSQPQPEVETVEKATDQNTSASTEASEAPPPNHIVNVCDKAAQQVAAYDFSKADPFDNFNNFTLTYVDPPKSWYYGAYTFDQCGLVAEFQGGDTTSKRSVKLPISFTASNGEDDRFYIVIEYVCASQNVGVVEVLVCGNHINTLTALWNNFKTNKEEGLAEYTIVATPALLAKWCPTNPFEPVLEIRHFFIVEKKSIRKRRARGPGQRFVLKGITACSGTDGGAV